MGLFVPMILRIFLFVNFYRIVKDLGTCPLVEVIVSCCIYA